MTVRGLAVLACLLVGCARRDDPQHLVPASDSAPLDSVRYPIAAAGTVTVQIDAPLEKFRGRATLLSGHLDLDVRDLTRARGEIVADLDAFTTQTFGVAADDAKQTEHARDWLELGPAVEPKRREELRYARFVLEAVQSASAKSLAEAKEEGGARAVDFTVRGQLRIHGRSAAKVVEIRVVFRGPPDAPTELAVTTRAPLVASLIEHAVEPRDHLGRFLRGAFETFGKKLDDKVQISVSARAVRP
ncbi:MAG: YceI family protein [Myxococcales bacterium]|nr:YceI family protein [Myxococcales bacterium]